MAKRAYTTKGDIFSVKIDEKSKRYFQLITYDQTQLTSDVIRAFKKTYPIEEKPPLAEIIHDEIFFHAHCVVLWGLKNGLWEKEGHIKEVEPFDQVLFRAFSKFYCDNSTMKLVFCDNWSVWRINEKGIYVEKLEGEHRNAEFGEVLPVEDIVYRMRAGVYPDYYYRRE